MPYTNLQGLVNDLASFYDDVNVTEFAIPGSKQGRYVHCVSLGIYEIWNYRSWYFKMAEYPGISFSNGEATLPSHFANVGPNGALFDAQGVRWKEIAFQDMVRIRAVGAGSSKPAKVFCVGTLDVRGSTSPGEGGLTTAYLRGLIIPSNETVGPFRLFYESSPPQIVTDPLDLTDPIPLPEDFHEPLLYAAVSKLQEFKGDPRDIWKSQYIAQLAKLAEIHYPLGSRMLQLPMTVGRGMW